MKKLFLMLVLTMGLVAGFFIYQQHNREAFYEELKQNFLFESVKAMEDKKKDKTEVPLKTYLKEWYIFKESAGAIYTSSVEKPIFFTTPTPKFKEEVFAFERFLNEQFEVTHYSAVWNIEKVYVLKKEDTYEVHSSNVFIPKLSNIESIGMKVITKVDVKTNTILETKVLVKNIRLKDNEKIKNYSLSQYIKHMEKKKKENNKTKEENSKTSDVVSEK